MTSTRNEQNDIHIAVLRCVLESNEPISISQIASRLGVEPDSLRWVNEEANTGGKCLWRQRQNENGEWSHVLSMAGRQILLDHDLLLHARRSSWIATGIAILALFISVAALVAQ